MCDELFSRFEAEVKSLIEDPDVHLSYRDKQRLKRGEYTDVAAEKLPTLKRRIWWTKLNAGAAAVLLGLGAVLTALSGLGFGADWTMEAFAFPLFFACCMGVAAVGGLWRMQELEKQRLLCELVLARSEADAEAQNLEAA
jgi:hypothetical protein